MALNIGAENAGDQFYRYKMPKLIAKIEGRGNGIKTNVVNMVDIAKALARPPSYTTKFFGCELGAQSNWNEQEERAIVNGAFTSEKMQETLEGFIKKFVTCFSCGNPETVMEVIGKGDDITLTCKACGHVSHVDMRHKLTTFIIKNPPVNKKSKKDKQLRAAEQEREKVGAELDAQENKEKKEKKPKKAQKETKPKKETNEKKGEEGEG